MRIAVELVGIMTLGLCASCGVAVPALALPEHRVYEMVSPPYKGGSSASVIVAVTPDGERVVFAAQGAFEGDPSNNGTTNTYIAHREEGVGWKTAPLSLPATLAPFGGPIDYSSVLDSALDVARLGSNTGGSGYEGTEYEYLLHPTTVPDTAPNALEPGPNFEMLGTVLKDLNNTPFEVNYAGASANFSHLVFEGERLRNVQLLTEAAQSESHLYELASSRGCSALPPAVCMSAPSVAGGEASVRLVGLNNQGKAINPVCTPKLGQQGAGFSPVSADGSEIFFTVGVDGACTVPQLFVRLGGEKTLEVSKPISEAKACSEQVPCPQAVNHKLTQFRGASQDGSKVFFTSRQPLVPGETDESENIYMARVGCPEDEPNCEPVKRGITGLVQVSHDPNMGEEAGVRNIVAIAPDGSRVYYVARGELLEKSEVTRREGEGRAVPHTGADNLYVYDSASGTNTFVADLCSGPQLSGEVEDVRCPPGLEKGESSFAKNDSPLWTAEEREAQLNVCMLPGAGECTGDRETGRFLVFSSYAQLSEGPAEGDTDNARDVYRYDAQAGMLKRVSLGEDGYDANGNGNDGAKCACDASISKSSTTKQSSLSQQRGLNSRTISEDGSLIVFSTAASLSPSASSGLSNAYIWHEGAVSLISTGSVTSGPVENALISSSGRDIFFRTTQGLVPQDTDGQADVYDARIEGGFPPRRAELESCKGDACQGPLSAPSPVVGGTATQAPGGNLPPPVKVTPKPPTRAQQLTNALKACRKKPKKRRASCERSARKKYAKVAKSAGGRQR